MGARDLLQRLAHEGLSVVADGNDLVVRPASRLTDSLRQSLKDSKPDVLDLLRRSVDQDRHAARLERLRLWGWPEPEAQALVSRLALRDSDDDRVSCAECRHYRQGLCGNHHRAGLNMPGVGRDLAGLLQRCPGFEVQE